MKTFTRNTCLIAITSALGLSTLQGVAQQNTDYSDAVRELDIMSNIFEAALEPRRDNDIFRHVSTLDEASYFADQGMVFSFIPSGGRGMMAFIDIGDMPGAAFAEMEINMAEMARDISEEVRRSLPSGSFSFPGSPFASIGIMEEEFEEMEEMSDDIREQQEEVRDLQRDMRDLQDEDNDSAEIEARIGQLQAQIDVEMEELDTLSSNYQSIMQEYREEREQEVAARNESARDLVISTLCDYGTTLRSLQNDEHVTVVMQNFNGNLDQVYVFDYADVASCSSAEQLLESAIAYQI